MNIYLPATMPKGTGPDGLKTDGPAVVKAAKDDVLKSLSDKDL